MFAEIIAIGSELTCGSKLDTNSQWLSRELEMLGWTVMRHTTLADDMEAIVREFRAAASRAQVVLITGGLAPTLDDITPGALSLAFHQQLVLDSGSLQQIRALFVARGREMPERNVRQADRPEHSDVLLNSCGTAPGILMRVSSDGDAMSVRSDLQRGSKGCLIAVMPGVPAEMRPMFERHVRPALLDSGMVLRRAVIRTFGFGESDAERLLGDLTARGRNPEVGITASEAVISLWVTARSKSVEEAERICSETCQLVRERLGDAVYADGNDELHDVLAELLKCGNRSVALVEGATTGGQLAMWLSENASVASVVKAAMVIPGAWEAAALRAVGINLPEEDIDSPEEWFNVATLVSKEFRISHKVDFVLLSSPFCDVLLDSGVVIRQGYVAVGSADQIRSFDVSMSGNLAIFRQRAARTALDQLRRIVKPESFLRNEVQ